MTNSRAKGKRGELEAVALLKEFGFQARRGQQYQGGTDSPDVVHDLPGYHIEVKRTEAGNPYDWLAQAMADRRDGEFSLVLHKRNGKDWIAVMEAREFLALVREYQSMLAELRTLSQARE